MGPRSVAPMPLSVRGYQSDSPSLFLSFEKVPALIHRDDGGWRRPCRADLEKAGGQRTRTLRQQTRERFLCRHLFARQMVRHMWVFAKNMIKNVAHSHSIQNRSLPQAYRFWLCPRSLWEAMLVERPAHTHTKLPLALVQRARGLVQNKLDANEQTKA